MSAYLNALSEAPREDVFNELVRQKERADRLHIELTQYNKLLAQGARAKGVADTHAQYQHLIFNFYRRKSNELS